LITSLQDSLAVTASYTVTLHETLGAIRDALPPDKPVVDVQEILSTQVHWTTEMANQLVGLAEHFEKMEVALKDSEAGEKFGEDDIQGMQSRSMYFCVVIQEHLRDDARC
jgi:autophagy-related protein 17